MPAIIPAPIKTYELTVVEKNEEGRERTVIPATVVSERDDVWAGVKLFKTNKPKQDLSSLLVKVRTEKLETSYSAELLRKHLEENTKP